VRTAVMEKRAAPGRSHRHYIGVTCGSLVRGSQLPCINAVLAAVIQNPLAGLILADESNGRKRKAGAEAREIFQDIVGRAAVGARLLYYIRQRVLRGPGIDDLRIVDDPIAGGENAGALRIGLGPGAHPFSGTVVFCRCDSMAAAQS